MTVLALFLMSCFWCCNLAYRTKCYQLVCMIIISYWKGQWINLESGVPDLKLEYADLASFRWKWDCTYTAFVPQNSQMNSSYCPCQSDLSHISSELIATIQNRWLYSPESYLGATKWEKEIFLLLGDKRVGWNQVVVKPFPMRNSHTVLPNMRNQYCSPFKNWEFSW